MVVQLWLVVHQSDWLWYQIWSWFLNDWLWLDWLWYRIDWLWYQNYWLWYQNEWWCQSDKLWYQNEWFWYWIDWFCHLSNWWYCIIYEYFWNSNPRSYFIGLYSIQRKHVVLCLDNRSSQTCIKRSSLGPRKSGLNRGDHMGRFDCICLAVGHM